MHHLLGSLHYHFQQVMIRAAKLQPSASPTTNTDVTTPYSPNKFAEELLQSIKEMPISKVLIM